MKRLLALLALSLAMALLPARADGPDEQYVRIYNNMMQADALNNSGQTAQALAKYLEAKNALERFQKFYPDWNSKIVKFRLNYLESHITALSPQVPAPVTVPIATAPVAPGAATSAPSSGSAEAERRLAALQEDMRRLQADKVLLEAKLKEALATQPAAVDPRELARAQARIQELLKENELLKTAGAAQPAKAETSDDAKVLAETQSALVASDLKLKEQTERANKLAAEKQELQNRLDQLTPGSENAAELARVKQARDEAERKLAEQSDLTAKLTAEKESLQARIQTLTAGAEAAATLRAENEVLKRQLAEAQAAGSSGDASRKLAQAEARVAALQSDTEILRLEKTVLESRLQTRGAHFAATGDLQAARAEDQRRIKLLETERFDLAMRLDAANKELGSRKGRDTAARIGELTTQINMLRARLQVYEARAIPYSAEELALFSQPAPVLAAADPKAGKKSLSELPRGTATLVVEAQREFAAKNYDKAEEKYLEVLRQDEKNTFTLANLAAIQLERNRLDEADQNIQKALTLDPNDAYSLSILGYIRYRQGRYDDALNALSRAAELNPQNAEVQNYLGVTLSQKGLRGPAETALRKAIQINPGYGDAHNNLAVIYATQDPPLIELARWHYQRALKAGQPHNADLEKMFEQKAGAPAATPK